MLGPWPDPVDLDVHHHGSVDCGTYVREKISYAVTLGQRVSAFVCVPQGGGRRAAVFCHHQQASNFALGKSEVVGLAGDPDQAYASELAELGFVTLAPDAIGFEECNWSPDRQSNVTWFELTTRLVQGKTLLATCLNDVRVGMDYLLTRQDVDPHRLGFIGHSYGARMALWAPAFDDRIRASVSNCGWIPYRYSHTRDTGIQAEFVIPGFATDHDIDDVIALIAHGSLLISAGTQDRWSRGAQEIYQHAHAVLGSRVELALYDTGHRFTTQMRSRAYAFLHERMPEPT